MDQDPPTIASQPGRSQIAAGQGRPVLRFAPSPNGYLHAGHALSALAVWRMSKRLGGRFLLRIEDIDPSRSRQTYIDAIYRDLEWLGIAWEEPVLRQSTRMDAYREAASRLDAMGLLYPCFASRTEILQAASPGRVDPDGAPLYPGLHRGLAKDEVARRLAAHETPAMRIDMARAVGRVGGPGQLAIAEFDDNLIVSTRPADPPRWGDAIIQRKETPTSYHLSVVVDDAWQEITHVVRGRDLLAATDIHRLLQNLLALPVPLYHHHRLITGETGRKLSKSARDTSLTALREGGLTRADLLRMVRLEPSSD